MAYEAMNNAAETTGQLTVILNDNDMSIAPPVGGMSAYMARLVSGGGYRSIRRLGKSVAGPFPRPHARKPPGRPRNMSAAWSPAGTFFEELAASTTIGPIDGHDVWTPWSRVLKNARDHPGQAGAGPCGHPEGQGLRASAEDAADKHHAVVKFDVVTGQAGQGRGQGPQLHQGRSPRN